MLGNSKENLLPDDQEEVRVAEVMEQIRAGIRQRQAQLPTLDDRGLGWEGTRLRQHLHELRAIGHVRERPFVSNKPVIGRFIVFVRETWNSVAAKWYVRPILRQQNIFNQTVSEMIIDLNRMIIDLNQRIDEIDQRAISADQDATLLVRKIAEGEYRLRQWESRATQDREDLAKRMSQLEGSASLKSPKLAEQGGDREKGC